MLDVACNEVEEGEIEGEVQQPSAPASTTAGGLWQLEQEQEQEQELETKKRKPKKEKKSKHGVAAALALQQVASPAVVPPPDGQPAQLYYDVYGQHALASVEVKTDHPIRLNDVQGLVLWTLAAAVSPRWAFIKNKPLIKQLVLVVAHGISANLFKQKQSQLLALQGLGQPVVVLAQSAHARVGQTTSALLNTSVRKRKLPEAVGNGKQQQQQQQQGGRGSGPSLAPPFPASHYCLSRKDMETLNYPLPQLDESSGAMRPPEGFLTTLPAAASSSEDAPPPPPPPPPAAAGDAPPRKREAADTPSSPPRGSKRQKTKGADAKSQPAAVPTSPDLRPQDPGPDAKGAAASGGGCGGTERLVALDCEMCVTARGFELTRISLVDGEGRVLMDELVLPHNPITDYNTRYSGITEEMLSKVTTRLEDVQKRFLKLVPAETLLVGHSLENDLNALRLVHARVLDTALLFPHPKGPPYRSALKVLALRFLKRKIQDGSHDSIIDARTALDLVHLKIKHGPSYGTSEFESANVRKLVDVLGEEHRHRCCLIDRRESLTRFATGSAAAIPVTSDDEAVKQLVKEAGSQKYGFVWTQLLELNQLQTNRAQHRQAEYLAKNRKSPAQPGSEAVTTAAVAAEPSPDDAEPELDVLGHEAARQQQAQEPGADLSEAALDAMLRRLDAQVGSILSSLPTNTLLMVATGQGDTAECRCQQEVKCKRMGRVDGLPEWTLQAEEVYQQVLDREIQGLCFCYVKQ